MQASNAAELTEICTSVFAGCCSNAFSLETLMTLNPDFGTALTFCQSVFISSQNLPSFIDFSSGRIPRLKPRAIPLHAWIVCVLLLTTINLLNNWAFSYRVPVSILILIRSAGLSVAMLLGFIFFKKRYSILQVFSVILVTAGVAVATLSRPKRASPARSTTSSPQSHEEEDRYLIGVAMLLVSLVLSGILGTYQEYVYKTYGPHWKEGVFYTHVLGLPLLLPMASGMKGDMESTFAPLRHKDGSWNRSSMEGLFALVVNLLSQDVCVKGVNKLTTRVTSVTANLIMTGRKAASICISIWWFGDGWNRGMLLGSLMVFSGTTLYGISNQSTPPSPKKEQNDHADQQSHKQSERLKSQ